MGVTKYFMDNYLTLRGSSSDESFIQPIPDWFDADRYRDAIFMIQASDFGGTPTIYLDTGPSEVDEQFEVLATYQPTGSNPGFFISRYADASTPMARYVRWRVTGAGSPWYVTFGGVSVGYRGGPRRTRSILLQDWITLAGNTSSEDIFQSPQHYVDSTGFADAVFYIQISEISGALQLWIQSLFDKADRFPFYVTEEKADTTGLTLIKANLKDITGPQDGAISSWLRWAVLDATGAWSITFRIWMVGREG